MLAAPRTETIGEPHKILFVNLVEDRHHRLLNDLIFQGCDAQGTLPPIGFRNVGSLGRLRSIRAPMDSAMQIRQLLIEVRLVLFPRHPVDSRRGFPLQGVKAYLQQIEGNMVEQRGEPRPLVFPCCLTHTQQAAPCADPAQSPGRWRLPSMPSASGCPPLFEHFVGSTQPSDSPPACMLDSRLMAFSNRPAATSATGAHGVSRFSGVEFPCMPGVSDCAESAECSRSRTRQYCLPPC
jgi:hypothetical protein